MEAVKIQYPETMAVEKDDPSSLMATVRRTQRLAYSMGCLNVLRAVNSRIHADIKPQEIINILVELGAEVAKLD